VPSLLERLAPTWTPHPGQADFLASTAKFKVLACGRRWGKTDACAADVLLALSRGSPTRHLILAPTIDQARILFERVAEWLERIVPRELLRIGRGSHPSIRYLEHEVHARSGHLPRALRGHSATHIVVDEAAFLPESVITEVALPMLATSDGSLTLISTPCGRNHFWRFFRMGQEGKHGIWSRHGPSSESPFVSREFLAIQREIVSDRAFRVEYEAEFTDSAQRVFRSEDAEACLASSLSPVDPTHMVSIGIDWARSQDHTAVAVLRGDHGHAQLEDMATFRGLPWRTMTEQVAAIVLRYPRAVVRCDSTGVGDAVTENLMDRCPEASIAKVCFTPAIKQAMISDLAWLFETAAIRMTPYPELLRQLEHFEYLSDGRKPKMGGTDSVHDDLVVALALAATGLPRPYRSQIRIGGPRSFSQNS